MELHLMSHALCPYVQRAVIALAEKGAPFARTEIGLAEKPDWFLKISPLGKTPVLVADGTALFESAPILEFLEDTLPGPLHPRDPVERARHRAWIEFGSAVLNDIAGFYNAPDAASLDAKAEALAAKFQRLEAELAGGPSSDGPSSNGPWFAGPAFSLVDAAFGPVLRYFDTFDRIGNFAILSGRPKVEGWRARLAARPSVAGAVGADYGERLEAFILRRDGHLATLLRQLSRRGSRRPTCGHAVPAGHAHSRRGA